MKKWEIPGHTLKWRQRKASRNSLKGRKLPLLRRPERMFSSGFGLFCRVFSDQPCERSCSFPCILETEWCQFSRGPCSNLSHICISIADLTPSKMGLQIQDREHLNDNKDPCLGVALLYYSKMPYDHHGNLCSEATLIQKGVRHPS